jgi:hypothetical protein
MFTRKIYYQISFQQLTNEYIKPDGSVLRVAQYQVQLKPSSFRCDTWIVEGFATLENSKFLLLLFLCEFMYKCIDMDKLNYIEGDIDGIYFAVAGKLTDLPEVDRMQDFKYVIKDEKFYNENVYKWFISSFYSTNNSNPTF